MLSAHKVYENRIYYTWLENTFDRKRISANSSPNPNANPNPKKQNNVFGLTKWHHFSRKCADIPKTFHLLNYKWYDTIEILYHVLVTKLKPGIFRLIEIPGSTIYLSHRQ